MIAWQVTIRGRVHGVGYRDAMVDAANALGLLGWVRNRREGTVEAWVQGDAAAVARLLSWCRRGPAPAQVTAIATLEVDPDPALDTFARRMTA
ncbi:MAG: acylphosphatase [Betaproteobacteria bacterium]